MNLEHLTDEQLIEYHRLYQSGMAKSARFESRKMRQQDSKFLYHLIRLFDECEQLMTEHDMDIQRAREMMKAIRRGDWTADEVRAWVMEKERNLETVYANCNLPEEPPLEPLKQLLMRCLEQHYGSLDECIVQVGWAENTLKEVDAALEKVRKQLYK